jgi:hypothetical protein
MKSVVICGSSSFASEMREFAERLKNLGAVVYEPHLYRASGGVWNEIKESDRKYVALGLTHDHFYKMRMADVIYIYNKDGYAGVSVNMEIGYAAALNKPIYVQEGNDAEPCRQVLFSAVVKTPEELIKFL